ncbi:MAG TPA: SAM-dependent methyltransferase [Streptosporangiaceae bacterium]|nr:SAM-dependent methyltransferase [Streptosporangiaceae bacterium]
MQDFSATDADDPFEIDTTVAHPARLYDYLLGGSVNFEADRGFAAALANAFPTAKTAAIENRRFLNRVVTYLVKEAGIRQFLDIGTGIPATGNIHDVAQAIDPGARIVYVDNDPIVLAHARQLLKSTADGATAYLHADLRDPEAILAHPELRVTLDLTQPVALLLIAVLHFVADADDPLDRVATLSGALPAGSYLAISHSSVDLMSPDTKVKVTAVSTQERDRLRDALHPRDKATIARFFDGMELIDPGIVPIADWRNDIPPNERPPATDAAIYGAVARISQRDS